MSDYYSELKPYLNKLSELNVWDNLFVIRQYYIDAFKNYDIEKPHFEEIEKARDCTIPVYLIDFMVLVSLKYSSPCRSTKSLRQIKTRLHIVKKMEEVYTKSNKEHFNTVLVWIKSFMLNQYKMQHFSFVAYRLYKYFYLFSSEGLVEHCKRILTMPIDTYIKIISSYFYLFSTKYCFSTEELLRKIVVDDNKCSRDEARYVLTKLYACLSDFKKIKIDFSNKLFLCHNDSKHVVKPIIKDGDFLYCPIPIYILNTGIDGLPFHLDLRTPKNKSLNDELAHRFEDYIGLQLNYYSKDGKYMYIKELEYNKKQNKTSDWIVFDDKAILFIDCKLKKLPIPSIMETSLNEEDFDIVMNAGKLKNRHSIQQLIQEQTSSLMKDIIEIGVDLGKILCCYYDWKEGKIGGLPAYNENRLFEAVLLTLEETFCGLFQLKELIDQIAYMYVEEKKGVKITKQHTSVISSTTFDNSISYIAHNGVYKHIVVGGFDNPGNIIEPNEFLNDCFMKSFHW